MALDRSTISSMVVLCGSGQADCAGAVVRPGFVCCHFAAKLAADGFPVANQDSVLRPTHDKNVIKLSNQKTHISEVRWFSSVKVVGSSGQVWLRWSFGWAEQGQAEKDVTRQRRMLLTEKKWDDSIESCRRSLYLRAKIL